jgi:hypothetical protein
VTARPGRARSSGPIQARPPRTQAATSASPRTRSRLAIDQTAPDGDGRWSARP